MNKSSSSSDSSLSSKNKTLKKEKLKKNSSPKSFKTKMSTSKKRYNEDFIEILSELADLMTKKGEPFRARAYKKAEETIIKYPDPIYEPSQLKGLPGIGSTILLKLEEFVETGKVAALEKERNDPVNLFAEIYGIGPKKAKEIVDSGITTIAQLNENKSLLNDKQKLGLKYYEDILKRIPRSEIDDFKETFTNIFKKIAPPTAKFEIVGSFRRGAKTSGDIDIIITDENATVKTGENVFESVINKLVKDNIITEVLSKGKTKSLTLVQIKKDAPIRRVDFLYSPPSEYAFALLYFTGSKMFNTVVRQRALDLGFTLNEHGLSEIKSGIKGKRVDKDFPTEKSILNFLGLEYVKPEDRIDGRSLKFLKAEQEPGTSLQHSLKEEVQDESPQKIKFVPKSKNKTLKKKTENVEDTIEKFRSEGINLLNMLTESELSAIIEKANQKYYCDEEPILTDSEYDLIREYVLEKYPDNEVAKEGHTKCDVEVSKKKVKLPYELWSMDKIKPSSDAIDKWLKKYKGPYVVSAKLDGISALYVNMDEGPKLYTRGNGIYGQDISHLIPKLIKKNIEEVAIRGEIIIDKNKFKEKYSKKFANPRNFVAGIVNKKTVDFDILKDLDFVAYEVISPSKKPAEQMKYLDELYEKKYISKPVKYQVEQQISNEKLSQILIDWRNDYKYEIDGVIVVNDEIYPRPKMNPVYAFAFKMVISDQVAETKVVNVIWTPSKDGYLKPRVQIEPVNLGGATVEYATGFNAKFIEDNKIGVGAIITIVRSGDVIPHIVSVIEPAKKVKFPDVPYKWNDTHVDIILDNKDDDKIVREKNIVAFFKNLEVEGLGPGNVKKLMETGYDTVAKILAMNLENYLEVDGFKIKTADKLYNGIKNKVEEASLVQIMAASNVFGRGFGEKSFNKIFEKYPNILVDDESKKDKIDQLLTVDGVAKITAEKFVEKIPEFLKFLKDANLDYKLDEKEVEQDLDTDHELYGKKIVLTGFRDKNLLDKLKKIGAEPSGSVTKNTFAVIVKDKDEDTGKADQARKLGIKIITIDEFEKLL